MARGDGVCEWHIIWEHTDGECEELHDHRPVLLLIKGLSKPDLCRLLDRRYLQKHKGHLWCPEPSNTLCLQWYSSLHKYNNVWSRTSPSRRGTGGWPILLECLWNPRNFNHSPHYLLTRWYARVTGRELLLWLLRVSFITEIELLARARVPLFVRVCWLVLWLHPFWGLLPWLCDEMW